MTEFELKQERIRALLGQQQLDALWLSRVSSVAWATCGAASYINTAASHGVAWLLVTPTQRHLITTNIEAPHFADEERLDAQGWEFHVVPWHEATPQEAPPSAGMNRVVATLTRGLRVGADGCYLGVTDLSEEIARLRAALTPEEGERFRTLGRLCAAAMEATVRTLQPGLTEYEIAARLAYETESRGAQAIVTLIGTDERIFRFRHPLPTAKKLERYAMLVLCGRKWGLVCSLTRLVHFGHLGDELRRKAEACAHVDAAFLTATRPGKTLGEIFQRGIEAYRANGFADEWQLHHQGGLAGYEPREAFGYATSSLPVLAGQAFAWNPSITGVKSEDTILVGANENEVITPTPGLPTLQVELDGQTVLRPAVLEVV